MPEEFFSPISNQGDPPVYKYFNGKEWVDSKSGKTTEVRSPIDNSVVGLTQIVTHEEVDEVFARARQAQTAWEAVPMHERIKIVHLAADWINHYIDYLTSLMTREIGKSVKESKSEIQRTAELTDYFADEVQSLKGEELSSDNFPGYEKSEIAIVERAAYGVIVAIAPFNYPVNLSASKIAPALLMGNSVVFKPPTQGAISALHMMQAFVKAGVPEGVVSCVTGGGSDIGDYVTSHPEADMLAFTGNSETGRVIANHANMKPLLFECGGNNPVVVFPDADMTKTAKEIIKGGFSYAGQRCTGIKYVLTTAAIQEKLIEEVKKQMPELVKMGDPRSPETKMVGPVISEDAAKVIESVINQATEKGAEIVAGGKRDGAYIEPTVLKNVTMEMDVVKTETFGPVVSFITIENFDDAVKIIHSTGYGLQASVFTSDEGSGIMFGKRLNVGTVQINGSPQRGPDHFPFMGVRKSGVGVQGVRYSLEAMSRLKSTVLNKPA